MIEPYKNFVHDG